MLETRIIDVTTMASPWSEPIVEQKQVYVETTTETKETIWHRDYIESLITQKKNDIVNLQYEIKELTWKLNEIIALSKTR